MAIKKDYRTQRVVFIAQILISKFWTLVRRPIIKKRQKLFTQTYEVTFTCKFYSIYNAVFSFYE